MKKLATTFGLLALMLVVTSFTTPQEIGGKNTQTKPFTVYEIGGKNTQTKPFTVYEIGGKNTQTQP